jgi:hypothetical protein
MAGENVLLVEGVDDKHVVEKLLYHANLHEQFTVRGKDGLPNILTTFSVEVQASGLQRIGIIVDADISVAERWNQVRGMLARAGYEDVPQTPDPTGTVLYDPERPVVGVWLMPNNLIEGMVEDFVTYLVPPDDRALPLARAALEGIDIANRRFPPQHFSKALIHTWLAWQEEPGVKMGAAIARRYLDPGAEVAAVFLSWIKRLSAAEFRTAPE